MEVKSLYQELDKNMLNLSKINDNIHSLSKIVNEFVIEKHIENERKDVYQINKFDVGNIFQLIADYSEQANNITYDILEILKENEIKLEKIEIKNL